MCRLRMPRIRSVRAHGPLSAEPLDAAPTNTRLAESPGIAGPSPRPGDDSLAVSRPSRETHNIRTALYVRKRPLESNGNRSQKMRTQWIFREIRSANRKRVDARLYCFARTST